MFVDKDTVLRLTVVRGWSYGTWMNVVDGTEETNGGEGERGTGRMQRHVGQVSSAVNAVAAHDAGWPSDFCAELN